MKTAINEVMVAPFTKIIKNRTLAYWTIGILMMVISWFFWPSPAVALFGAVLLPVQFGWFANSWSSDGH